jgi:hypothetical protein
MDYLGYTIQSDGSMVKEHVTIAAPSDIGPGTYNSLKLSSLPLFPHPA